MSEVYDRATELVSKIEKNDEKGFLAEWNSIPWDQRSQYAPIMNSLSDHHVENQAELPHIHLDTNSMTDIAGVTHEYVSKITEDEARAWYNPLKYLFGERSQSSIYSPSLSERIAHNIVDRALPFQDAHK